jgi:hypothetical protein
MQKAYIALLESCSGWHKKKASTAHGCARRAPIVLNAASIYKSLEALRGAGGGTFET